MSGKPLVRSAVLLLCLAVVVSLSAVGCGEQKVDTSKETYKIGAVLSLSGPAAPLGQPEQRALEMLQEQLNAGAGVEGHQVEFVIEDDESLPAKATEAMNKLITTENVAAVIGSSTTGASLAMSEIAQSKQIPLVVCAAGTQLTQPVKKYIFRTPPTDSMAIAKVLDYLVNKAKVKKIAILHDANAFGTGGADELAKKAPGEGVEVVARESYGSTDTDMTAQLTKIKETPAEALVVWGTNPGPAIIAKNMQQLGMNIPFVGSHGIANKKFIELAGAAANGVVFPAGKMLIPSSIPEDSEWRTAVDDFKTEFQTKYNLEADTFAGHGYDAGLIVTDAMKTAGTDKAMLRNQIEKTKDLVGIGGIFTYSPTNHDGLSEDDLMMIKIANGNWTEDK
ncbi:MAG: ABC transporter substrate-binding protein [Actinomycetota bacterium]